MTTGIDVPANDNGSGKYARDCHLEFSKRWRRAERLCSAASREGAQGKNDPALGTVLRAVNAEGALHHAHHVVSFRLPRYRLEEEDVFRAGPQKRRSRHMHMDVSDGASWLLDGQARARLAFQRLINLYGGVCENASVACIRARRLRNDAALNDRTGCLYKLAERHPHKRCRTRREPQGQSHRASKGNYSTLH